MIVLFTSFPEKTSDWNYDFLLKESTISLEKSGKESIGA
jgi:hypothetical protein